MAIQSWMVCAEGAAKAAPEWAGLYVTKIGGRRTSCTVDLTVNSAKRRCGERIEQIIDSRARELTRKHRLKWDTFSPLLVHWSRIEYWHTKLRSARRGTSY